MERIRIRRRIHGKSTPALQKRLDKARAQIAKELPDLIRRNQRAHDARQEKTFSGLLRRAVHDFPMSPMKIAEHAEMSWDELDNFLTGEKSLASDAIDRLVKVLKLKLAPASGKAKARRAKAG